MPLKHFHPAVERWFSASFPAPTEAQVAAWPSIIEGRHTLVAAPTGSGKTLTAFLAAIDALVRRGLEHEGKLPDEVNTLYVSPLKALSNDIRTNLEIPIAGIRAELVASGLPDVHIQTAVRTGDTPQNERQHNRRKPPHILVTTPESLYVLLGSSSGRKMLSTVRTVIIDEIHALAPNKRGSHLSLSLERLQALCDQPITRIGLSATQKPIETVAHYLVGNSSHASCKIVDIGYRKQRDLALEIPPTPLGAVMSNDQWEQVYARLGELASQYRTTLVFVNTRRMAERAARHLGDILGKDVVATHHGSLSREARLDAEQRLKSGALKVLVATASLELGLDIGDVDLVCQLASPRSISSFLQRAGRAAHHVGGIPKARLFPQTRDELIECIALLDAVHRGELDALVIPPAPLDVLAQQIVAETACQEWNEDELFEVLRRAMPYGALTRESYASVLHMLSEGFTTRQGQRGAYVHHDVIHQRLRERRGSRLTALTSGGTIPETGDYTVILEPDALKIGTVNEDFAVESLRGDVFQLGNISYRILRIEPGRIRVEDAKGAPPSIPFWLGEAPGRSDELSFAVSRLRADIVHALQTGGQEAALQYLLGIAGVGTAAALTAVEYLVAAHHVLGVLPTQECIVFERFFDASGGMQLVLHSPFGSRLNRAWGLALRKRFCRQFNFELQAAATEDAIVLSLSTSHSFPLEEVARYLRSGTALDVLVQALLDAPLFGVRWRWNATTALALPRFVGGRKVAPQLQRMKSEDLLAAVFPDQLACAENLNGAREIPDHPLVAQTLYDCLYEAMDAEGWVKVLQRIEKGDISVVALDLPAPSPTAQEVLQAKPYAFLDDAPLEERRTQAVQSRHYGEADDGDQMGQLDPQAIESVRREAWPEARHADEMHEALMMLGLITDAEASANEGWLSWLTQLAADRRATHLLPHPQKNASGFWVAAERLKALQVLYPESILMPEIEGVGIALSHEDVLVDLLRARLSGLGPVTITELTTTLQYPAADLETGLIALRTEGSVFEGHITPHRSSLEWCERHLLARIHRYTLNRLRREIEPVEPRDFVRFLFEWQHLTSASQVKGAEALSPILLQLEGFEAPATLWESEILSARIQDYSESWLDEATVAGRTAWARLRPQSSAGSQAGRASLRASPVLLLPRRSMPLWLSLASAKVTETTLGSKAQRVIDYLESNGASFFDEIVDTTRLLRSEAEDALAECVVKGRVHCDSYTGLRALLLPAAKRSIAGRRRKSGSRPPSIENAGRWTAISSPAKPVLLNSNVDALQHIALVLLRRYGVICWRILEREASWLPLWRDLVRVYRRLEARGEIRGGRFIAGLSGEQFALPEAIGALRQVRRQSYDGALICLTASDPANMLGGVLPGDRIPRAPGALVLFQDGLAIATYVGRNVKWLQPVSEHTRSVGQQLLTLEASVRRTRQSWLSVA